MSLTRNNFVPPQLVLDSVSAAGKRITTFKLRYPKMVHGDFMTHRVFSRNASSSRAIPTKRLSAGDVYVPEFRVNKPGMQPGEYLADDKMREAQNIWNVAADHCLLAAQKLSDADDLNVHKQWTNRMLEWFGYINVIVTATDYDNFIGLREELNEDDWPMAQDEIYFQATGIRDLLASSKPTLLSTDQWHLPFILDSEWEMSIDNLRRISAARCAGISYETVDGLPMTIERAEKICNKLLTSRRVHASPFEHQATPDPMNVSPHLHGNLDGWIQYRKLIPHECIKREAI